jgi:hypothetical protein
MTIATTLLTAAQCRAHTAARRREVRQRDRWGDRGEGVISAAIAVLIMAFLGVAMWVGFNQIWTDAETTTGDQVRQIGR